MSCGGPKVFKLSRATTCSAVNCTVDILSFISAGRAKRGQVRICGEKQAYLPLTSCDGGKAFDPAV